MNNFFQNLPFKRVLLFIKSWLPFVLLLILLRYTGILSGISFAASSALLKIGVMDAKPNDVAVVKSFDYNFSIKDMDGKVIDFNTYKGKTIFINLWATWCGPCRVEMPSIQKLYDRVNHEEIIFVMISLDDPKNTNKILKFISDRQLTLPVYQPASALPDELDVPSIPTTLVIDPKGKIVSKKVGAANFDTDKFEKFLTGLSSK
ncbi:MAG TPA: TlpA disulfide reductase family protein [Chryseolinea sp.]|nr:TlpA disulfide reductase family protein [Chryseolinea sp.]HPM30837.1 TlpA disulfide reductase family protein [Chryseolinea sp.]